MAKIFYLLKQNKAQGSKIFGKWFAHGKTIETLNTRKMANHISEHGSGKSHQRARKYLHPRRGVRCAGEVPQLSA